MHPDSPTFVLRRRQFIATGLTAAFALLGDRLRGGPEPDAVLTSGTGVMPEKLFRDLLRDWCDAMVALQIDDPARPAEHGALRCPSCSFIHGRCMDAVYPLLHQAKVSGAQRYLDAGIKVFEWSKNVSQDDGSWTVVNDPKSWRGITIFGAIALAEALHHHGDLLDETRRAQWLERLARAARYVHETFTIDFTNINYPATAVYGLHLFGQVLGEPAYAARARVLADGIKKFITEPGGLLGGEGKPSTARSARGLPPVDLGYNVEESLPALALYAAETGDEALTRMVVRSMRSHLEFMLPDGAWDNSWGTRHAKWSYWGSRTCDGCQPGFAALAHLEPAFATAAVRNAELLRRCTHDGLLHGGPDYAHRGAKPCVHHTFTHAKALAAVLDRGGLIHRLDTDAPLPRAHADGIREWPEVATWLAARGPWRGTITAYDFVYSKQAMQPTGGVLSMLWHEAVGPVFAASMPRYVKVEVNNMQDDPDGADDPLTPRVETWIDGRRFSHLHDLQAGVSTSEAEGTLAFEVRTRLVDEAQHDPPGGRAECLLRYEINPGQVRLAAVLASPPGAATAAVLVLPVISRSGEPVRRVSDRCIEIARPGGTVAVEASSPIRCLSRADDRIFNLVPGFEALALGVDVLAEDARGSIVTISVRPATRV